MKTKSSIGNAVGNNVYEDLILTSYPKYKDSRDENEPGGKVNQNLKRWTNLKDYNMAEHINALQDAVMAIQRTLGAMVQVPSTPTDDAGNIITNEQGLINIAKNTTLKDRLDAIERFDWANTFDQRYGGPTWEYDEDATTNPTIEQHRHLGSDSDTLGMPDKIVLTEEVQGQLPKSNINLTKSKDGLTGADIYLDTKSNLKVSDSINDKLSEQYGGTISKSATLEVLGKTNTRWTREFDIEDAVAQGNSKVVDNNTLLKTAIESPSTQSSVLLNKELTGMYFGSYVIIARLSTNSLTATDIVEIAAIDRNNNVKNRIQLKGTDFDTANKYKSFYLLFDNEEGMKVRIRKLNTSSSVSVRFDYAVVTPVHPAVFDF